METEGEAPAGAVPAEPSSLDYEAALAELDGVLAQLDSGQVPLEDAMGLYERGVQLVRRCSALLDGAERRISELTIGPDGLLRERPMLLELDEEAGHAEG